MQRKAPDDLAFQAHRHLAPTRESMTEPLTGGNIDHWDSQNRSGRLDPATDGRRLIFLAGLHRSGTSLLHRCLSDHPHISGFENTGAFEDEGQHLQTVYPPAYSFGGPGLFGFAEGAYLDERAPLATPENAHRLLSEWEPFWDTNKRMLVEKSPPNLIRTRFLQSLFPGSRFVVVLRHPIAVSYATQKWTPATVWIQTLLKHWLTCHERFERDRAHLDHVHVLRYEDFVASPERELNRIHRFLDLDPVPLQREVRPGVNDDYFAIWARRRRNPLTRPYTSYVVRKLGDRVARFGYSLTDWT